MNVGPAFSKIFGIVALYDSGMFVPVRQDFMKVFISFIAKADDMYNLLGLFDVHCEE